MLGKQPLCIRSPLNQNRRKHSTSSNLPVYNYSYYDNYGVAMTSKKERSTQSFWQLLTRCVCSYTEVMKGAEESDGLRNVDDELGGE